MADGENKMSKKQQEAIQEMVDCYKNRHRANMAMISAIANAAVEMPQHALKARKAIDCMMNGDELGLHAASDSFFKAASIDPATFSGGET